MWHAEDHTADACLYVEAGSWHELLEEAARALAEWAFSGEIPADVPGQERHIAVVGADATETWVHFWRALHRSWVVEGLLPTSAALDPSSDEHAVRATVRCCPTAELDPERLEDVKAVTWHGAEIGRTANGNRCGRIVLDI